MANFVTDSINDRGPYYAILGRNGHDVIDSSFSPVSGRTYFWAYVQEDIADVDYTDGGGNTHTAEALIAGTAIDLSGAAPTITGAGSLIAWIDNA